MTEQEKKKFLSKKRKAAKKKAAEAEAKPSEAVVAKQGKKAGGRVLACNQRRSDAD
jgi:hypothetical protein